MKVGEWVEKLTPFLGEKIDALAWAPINCDTPQLVAQMDETSFSFACEAILAFEGGDELYLTYGALQTEREGVRYTQYVLSGAKESSFSRFGLDRVRTSMRGHWAEIERRALFSAELYASPQIESDHVIGIRFTVEGFGRQTRFWIALGTADHVGEQDDLWVGVEVNPPNFAELIEVGRLPA